MASVNIGFIGLGNMGAGIAYNLLTSGNRITLYNRTRDKAIRLLEADAHWADSPALLAASNDVIFSMLSDDEAVLAVSTGPGGLLETIMKDSIHVSLSTIGAETSRKLEKLHEEKGAWFIAAPVFGKPDAARDAKLWMAYSGNDQAKARVKPLLSAISQGSFDFGQDVGAANIVKLSGNFLLASAIEAMAEAYTLAESNGIPRKTIHEFFISTLFNTPVYKTYGKLVAEEIYRPVGAPPSLIRKDMRLLTEQAQQSEVPMPFLEIIYTNLSATVSKGKENIDWSGFAAEASENAGLEK